MDDTPALEPTNLYSRPNGGHRSCSDPQSAAGVRGRCRTTTSQDVASRAGLGSQMSVLTHLEHQGPATMTALARAEGVRPQSMGATVSVLRAAGPVSGTPDPTNGRQTILSLTASPWNAFTAGRAIREDWLFSAIRSNLAPDEQERYCQKASNCSRGWSIHGTAACPIPRSRDSVAFRMND